jgi:hypothetical protein
VPPGQARPEVVAAQRKVTWAQLAKSFADLVEATADPFVQPILDLGVPKMVVGRVCLVSDAALTAWEPAQLEIGRDLERHGKMLGDRSQFPSR